MRTIVFFDVDGTLVGRDRTIPADTLDALRRLRENGHLAVVNTGRPYGHVEPVVINAGFDGFVCSCGAHIRLHGEEVSYRRPPAEACRRMIEKARDCRMMLVLESEEGIFFDFTYPLTEDAQREHDHYKTRGFNVDYDIDTPGFRFDKFCAFQTEGCRWEDFLQAAAPWFDAVPREHGMFEMVVKGCSKELGVRLMAEAAGIAPEDCFAFGDGGNDIPMFRAVGTSIAMGNAYPVAKEAADYITLPCEEGGIAAGLRHFGLI